MDSTNDWRLRVEVLLHHLGSLKKIDNADKIACLEELEAIFNKFCSPETILNLAHHRNAWQFYEDKVIRLKAAGARTKRAETSAKKAWNTYSHIMFLATEKEEE